MGPKNVESKNQPVLLGNFNYLEVGNTRLGQIMLKLSEKLTNITINVKSYLKIGGRGGGGKKMEKRSKKFSLQLGK